MNWYKKAQEIYRGDPNPIDLANFDVGYGVKELGKQLGSSAAWGPGIYFATKEDVAQMYGSNITKRFLSNARIITKQSPMFSLQQIDKMLQGVDKEKIDVAVSNWDEDYNRGRKMLVQSIVKANNPMEQLMSIWADAFQHQDPNAFVELMNKNGIDGISLTKEDVTYYVIYNKGVLK